MRFIAKMSSLIFLQFVISFREETALLKHIVNLLFFFLSCKGVVNLQENIYIYTYLFGKNLFTYSFLTLLYNFIFLVAIVYYDTFS